MKNSLITGELRLENRRQRTEDGRQKTEYGKPEEMVRNIAPYIFNSHQNLAHLASYASRDPLSGVENFF